MASNLPTPPSLPAITTDTLAAAAAHPTNVPAMRRAVGWVAPRRHAGQLVGQAGAPIGRPADGRPCCRPPPPALYG